MANDQTPIIDNDESEDYTMFEMNIRVFLTEGGPIVNFTLEGEPNIIEGLGALKMAEKMLEKTIEENARV